MNKQDSQGVFGKPTPLSLPLTFPGGAPLFPCLGMKVRAGPGLSRGLAGSCTVSVQRRTCLSLWTNPDLKLCSRWTPLFLLQLGPGVGEGGLWSVPHPPPYASIQLTEGSEARWGEGVGTRQERKVRGRKFLHG